MPSKKNIGKNAKLPEPELEPEIEEIIPEEPKEEIKEEPIVEIKKVKPKRGGKKKEEKVEEPKEEVEEEKDDKRTFKCYYDNNKILDDDSNKDKIFGRFKGIRPRQAANKAFSAICKEQTKEGKNIIGKEIIFSIIECTRKTKNRKFNYIGKREELKEKSVREVQVGGSKEARKIIYKFKNNIRKYNIEKEK
jgi:hypothetical protein